MKGKKASGLTPAAPPDSAKTLRQITTQVDRMFDQEIRWPATGGAEAPVVLPGQSKSRPTTKRRSWTARSK
jgi:hypothetical protein